MSEPGKAEDGGSWKISHLPFTSDLAMSTQDTSLLHHVYRLSNTCGITNTMLGKV